MYKYIGLYCPDGDPREHVIFPDLKKLLSIKKDKWRKVYDGNDLLLFDFMDKTSGMQSHTLDDKRGVILGHIFTPKPDGSHQMAISRAPKVFSFDETKKYCSPIVKVLLIITGDLLSPS